MATKDKVLEELSGKNGEAVSGQQLADLCGISRAAIWKAINSLREEGYKIEGTTNGGYRLVSSEDAFSQKLFCDYLMKNFAPVLSRYSDIFINCFKEIDSTNTYAKKYLMENSAARTGIVVAECQTAGRGRLGRTFYSPSNSGIYLSVIYSPENGVTKPARLTAFSAVAVCRAVKKLYEIEPSVKWINDIFAAGKKICGILTEGFTSFETGQIESAIIGIGVNIKDNPEVFPEEVKKVAGSIVSAGSKKTATRCELAAEIAGQVFTVLNEDPEKILEEYKKLIFMLGKEVEVFPVIGDDKSSYKAIALDIDEEAGLVVQLADGNRKVLSSGEVSLKSSSLC